MKSNTKLALAIAAALAATLGTSAQAASTGGMDTQNQILFTQTEWSNSLQYPKFESNLGTLTSMTLYFTSSLETFLTVTNTDTTSSMGGVRTDLKVTLNDAELGSPTLDVLSPGFGYMVGAGGSTTSNQITQTNTTQDVYTSDAILAEFTGHTGETISLPFSTFTQTADLSNSGGNVTASQSSQASLTGEVIYTYTPASVPEPSVALLGLCGLGMVAGFKRHSRNARP